jgi:rubredoxin
MAQPHDRPAANPGGMQCEDCGAIFVGAEWHARCAVCEGKAQPMPAAPEPTKKTDAQLIEEGVICCDKATKGGTLVSFNLFNAVVQCHACGTVYTPAAAKP